MSSPRHASWMRYCTVCVCVCFVVLIFYILRCPHNTTHESINQTEVSSDVYWNMDCKHVNQDVKYINLSGCKINLKDENANNFFFSFVYVGLLRAWFYGKELLLNFITKAELRPESDKIANRKPDATISPVQLLVV